VSAAKDAETGAVEADIQAEAVALQRVDEAGAVARPTHIGALYVESEYAELEAEQPPLFEAAGIEAAREAQVTAAALRPAAAGDERLTSGHLPVLEEAERRMVATRNGLASFRRRPPKAKLWHYATKAAFLGGDLAGIATAAIWLGEDPSIAVIMAASAATATVTAGLSGAEVRHLRDRARLVRPEAELTDAQRPFAHLFTAPDTGGRYVKQLVAVSAAVGGCIAVAVGALRMAIEDPLVGVVFGGIAAAIAAASWIESYMYADASADLIDNADADYERELARHQRLAGAVDWTRRESALAEVDSLTAEHTKRGIAAATHLRALRARILRNNPGVAGHGPGAEPTGVGQTPRRTGGAR
jgi:hypothetical protein